MLQRYSALSRYRLRPDGSIDCGYYREILERERSQMQAELLGAFVSGVRRLVARVAHAVARGIGGQGRRRSEAERHDDTDAPRAA